MTRPSEAFVSSNLFEIGLGRLVYTRFRGGKAESGVFLVDVYCLGVKDAFYAITDELTYNDHLQRMLPPENRKPIDLPSARKLIEDAVAYARGLGFQPHPDYRKGCRVFGGINAGDSNSSFTFGKDGKPFYIQGPSDSVQKKERILAVLQARFGMDGFHFLVCEEGGDDFL